MIAWYWILITGIGCGIFGYVTAVLMFAASDNQPNILSSNEWNDVILSDSPTVKEELEKNRN